MGAAPPEEPPAADDTTAPPEGEVQPADATEGGDGTDASPETEAAVAGGSDGRSVVRFVAFGFWVWWRGEVYVWTLFLCVFVCDHVDACDSSR